MKERDGFNYNLCKERENIIFTLRNCLNNNNSNKDDIPLCLCDIRMVKRELAQLLTRRACISVG